MKKYKHIVLLLCLLAFIFLTIIIFNKEQLTIDIIGNNLISNIVNNNVTEIMKIITWFGSSYCIIIISIILFITIKNKKIPISIVLNIIIIVLLNQVLKFIFHRDRPLDNIIIEQGYSFPSGHAMVSVSLYGYLIYLIYKYVNKKIVKILLTIPLVLLILLVSISRIYLKVHYTTDVLAGILLSIIYLIIFIHLTNKTLDRSFNMKLVNSFKYAFTGIFSAFKTERNMKIHVSIMLLVILLGIILKISLLEWLICIIWFSLVISGELFNTSIETIVDMVSPNKNENAKKAKDISAGAVLISALGSIVTGLIIFIPKIIDILF